MPVHAIEQQKAVIDAAKIELVRIVHSAFPLGSMALYSRSERVPLQLVQIVKHSDTTTLMVLNPTSKVRYFVDGASWRLTPVGKDSAK